MFTVCSLFSISMIQEDGSVDYNDVLSAFNWREMPISKPTNEDEQDNSASAHQSDDPRMLDKTTHERKRFNVEYYVMLQDLGINTSYPLSTAGTSSQ